MKIEADALTYAEAAATLGVSPRTIRLAVARGELPATHLNARVVRIALFDLRLWRERKTCRNPAQVAQTRAF
jgi:excisionase family DNA binding protein